MLNNLRLSVKMAMVIGLFTVALAGLSVNSLVMYRNSLIESEKARLQNIVDLSYGIITHYQKLASDNASVSEDTAQLMARDALRGLRYAGSDYIFVFDKNGGTVVHGARPELEGTSLADSQDANGVYFIREMVKIARDGGGFLHYDFPREGSDEPQPKLSYSLYFEPWDWMVGTGVYIDDVDRKFYAAAAKAAGISLAVILMGVFVASVIARSISGPLARMTGDMNKLASRNYDFEILYTDSRNEIGELARALEVFRENAREGDRLRAEQEEAKARQADERCKMMNAMADSFEAQVGGIVEIVGSAATELEALATQLSASAEEASRQSASVAGASEQASANVQTVAAAAEQLSASIRDISRNITDTASTAKICTRSAQTSKEKLSNLEKLIAQIDTVLQSIVDVAEQTNLLALNATIEAARAGDAGKGFAVVASEVKSLATRTQQMTDEISSLIKAIKDGSGETVMSVDEILRQIEAVGEKTTSVAASVEEQNNSTVEISRNIQQASQGTQEVSANVVGIQQAANESASATASLRDSAGSLSKQSAELKTAVRGFISQVRAA